MTSINKCIRRAAKSFRRLSILNKCANLKLDRTLSREVLADQEEEEYEQYAISDQWFLEENGRRWARIEETESSLDSPSLENKIVLGRARAEDTSSANNGDNNNTVGKSLYNLHPYHDHPSPSGDDSPVTEKPPKQKGSRFLKRFGGDLKKLSSFKKREFLQRSHSADKAQEHSPRSDKLHFSSGRGFRKNHKVVIGQPTLEEGCERVNQMKCAPVHHPACAAHGQNMGRKNSSHSLISTSSSGAGSIASTTASRTNPSLDGHSCSECSKETEQSQDRNSTLYLAPPPHKPGTFPTILREQTEAEEFSPAFSLPSSESSSRSHSTSDVIAQCPDSSRKLPRARSIYDNLDDAGLCTLTQDFLNIFDLISPVGIDDESGLFEDQSELLDPRIPAVDVAFWSVDDIVEHTQSLQQMVQSWQSDEESYDGAVNSMENIAGSPFLASTDAVPSASSENASATESETDAVRSNHIEQLNQLQTKWETLKRSMPVCKGKKIDASQLHSLSAGQLMILRRLAVLKLTASMEKFSNKTSHSWSVPRFIRRFKVPDYKDKNIFGVPLFNNVQQFGQALPPCILHALDYLRNTSLEQIGIFRKPGVRLRIENLRAKCEDNPNFKDFDSYSAFDVADLVKKYFRELPDPLMTVKMSDTFVGIFSNICQELRLAILQAAILLLPDENREAFKTLLHFLLDVALNASENQMSASNLATCLSPSLFHLQINSTKLTSASSSPKLKKSQMGKHPTASVMKPNIKEMNDNKAATECLTFMIENIEAIFKIPEDSTTQCRMSVMHQPEDVLASEIGSRTDEQESGDYFKDYHAHVDKIVAQTLREEQKFSQNKTGNWQNAAGPQGTEVMYKKLNDGNPLRLWRTKVEINNASPDEVLNKILSERNVWDDNLVQCEVLEQPDKRTQVYQYVVNEMHPHPSRDYCVLRTWREDSNARGSIVLVENSTNPQPLVGDVRGVVLTSRYVIEPCDSQKCSLVHVCRIDTKGHNPEWYNKSYGHLAARNLLKIRDSLQSNLSKSTKAS